MVKIYKENATGKLYALDEQITMGTKVCLKPFDKRDDKFVQPSTLKRGYTQYKQVQVVVEVKAFTGMKIGMFEGIWTAGNDTLYVKTKNGNEMTFSYKSGKQTNPKNPKYANKLGFILGYPLWN